MIKNTLKKIIAGILRFEARIILKKYKPKIIAVTGNVGKTSTKEAVYDVLQAKFNVRKSEQSYNNEFGVPLTIIGRQTSGGSAWGWTKTMIEGLLMIVFRFPYPTWLVLELGADRPGDMQRMADWIKFDIAILTSIPEVPVHIEFFKSHKEFVKEKATIVRSLAPDGLAVLSYDDKIIREIGEGLSCKKIYFGGNEKVDLRVSNEQVSYREASGKKFPEGISFKIDYEGSSMPIRVKGVVGYQQIYALLAAIAVGVSLDVNLVDIAEALSNHVSPAGRFRLIPGIKDTLIIDDTYNSSPVALGAALKALKNLESSGRKIAVLGDMLELGSHTIEEHKSAGKKVKSVVDELYVVGLRAKFFAEGAIEAGMDKDKIFYFDDPTEVGEELQNKIQAGDLVLIKGSQGIRLEKAVAEVMLEPEKKRSLLVRQSREWR